MAGTQTLRTGIGLDTRDFAEFARTLRKAAPELNKALRLRLRSAGEIVADEARTRILPFSSSVPPSIKVRTAGAGVSVIAGGPKAPLGGLFELGNRGSRGGDVWKHPVFGHRAVWVEQAMHPYLAPALEAKIPDVEVAVNEALDLTIAEITR